MTRARSATEEVFERLRALVVSGELPPGSQHSIYRLAEELGHSRTPVREAVLRLADAGLVTVERNRGIRVRGVRLEDVCDVFVLRLLLEVPVAGLAAAAPDPDLGERLRTLLADMRQAADADDEAAMFEADRALHAVLGDALGNARLSREVDRLRDSISVRGVSTVGEAVDPDAPVRTLRDVAEEHAPIVDAVVAGDPMAARRAMRAHLATTAELLVRRSWGDAGRERWASVSSMLLTADEEAR